MCTIFNEYYLNLLIRQFKNDFKKKLHPMNKIMIFLTKLYLEMNIQVFFFIHKNISILTKASNTKIFVKLRFI